MSITSGANHRQHAAPRLTRKRQFGRRIRAKRKKMHRRLEHHSIRADLARSVHFRDLADADLQRLAALSRLRTLRGGETAARAGRRQTELLIVLEGCLRVSSVTPEGKEFVYALLGPGGFYGLGAVIRGVAATTDVRAVRPTALAVIDGAALLALLDERPRLWRHVAGLLHKRMILALTLMRDITVAPLGQRVARKLLEQALTGGDDILGSAPLALHLTQSELGRMLGVSRSQVSGELRRLENEGLVKLGYRDITLINLARLREVAGSDLFAY